MTDLKTLNEVMQDWTIQSPTLKWVKTDKEEMPSAIAIDLRQEAIKWCKSHHILRKEALKYGDMQKSFHCSSTIGTLMVFFNLSEEDLER